MVINEPKWRGEESRPFTPTSLRDDKILEFTVKRYPSRKGVTDKLHNLEVGAKLLISAPGFENRRITVNFLKEKIQDFTQHFYVCGPDSFVEDIKSILKELGASPDSVVFEE
jgi:ferredoxin-NADP reductase